MRIRSSVRTAITPVVALALLAGAALYCPPAASQPQAAALDWSEQAAEIEAILRDTLAAAQEGDGSVLGNLLADPLMIVTAGMDDEDTAAGVLEGDERARIAQWINEDPPAEMVVESIDVTMIGPHVGIAGLTVSLPGMAEPLTVASVTLIRVGPEWQIVTLVFFR